MTLTTASITEEEKKKQAEQQAAQNQTAEQQNVVTMPEGYKGSTNIYGNTSGTAQGIIDKMNQNSIEWYSATPERQAELHSENEYLSGMLGTYGVNGVSYDPTTGTWTGTALDESTVLPSYQAAQLPSATNQSDAIGNYYTAAQEATLAALKSAYDQNIINTDAAAEKIPAIYQAAQNQAAAQGALTQKNFNEYAAASGLSTGTGGQAALAQGIATQSDINALETEKANALKDVETQRLSIQTEYQNAIAEAVANNELAKAEALYNEAVRVDESIVATALNQATENYKAWTSGYQTQSNYVGNLTTSDQYDYQKALTNAQTLAAYGDFSGYAALGYTDAQIQQMYSIWAAQNPTLAAALGYTGGTTGTLYTGEATATNPVWDASEADVTNLKANVGTIDGKSIADYDATAGNYASVKATCDAMVQAGRPTSEILSAIKDAWNSGVLNTNDYMSLYNKYRG